MMKFQVAALMYGQILRLCAIGGMVLAAAPALALETTVVSAGPFFPDRPVRSVVVYFFIDAIDGGLPEKFRAAATEEIRSRLRSASVPSDVVWFSDTSTGKKFLTDVSTGKVKPIFGSFDIPVGRVMAENLGGLVPSHQVIVSSVSFSKDKHGRIFEARWEFKDIGQGYLDWSLVTRTAKLPVKLSDDQASRAGKGLADALLVSMAQKGLIRK